MHWCPGLGSPDEVVSLLREALPCLAMVTIQD